MKKTLILTGLLFVAFIFVSCESSTVCTNADGQNITQNRDVVNFDGVKLAFSGKVIIKQDSEFNISVDAPEDVIDLIITEIDGNTLLIKSEKCIKTDKPILVYVSAPNLTNISVEGSGDIVQDGFWSFKDIDFNIAGSGDILLEDIEITGELGNNIAGSGDIRIKGKIMSEDVENNIAGSGDIYIVSTDSCEDMEINIAGSGSVYANDLKVNKCDIQILGSGDANVNVIKSLDIRILGSGDVKYSGTPDIDVETKGSGDVLKAK